MRSPAYRKQPELSADEARELERLSDAHADRAGVPRGGSALERAETLVRAARPRNPNPPAEEIHVSEASEDRPDAERPEAQPAPVSHYDDLAAEEIVSLLDSLESGDLLALRDHERAERARPRVLAAIDAVLARREAAAR